MRPGCRFGGYRGAENVAMILRLREESGGIVGVWEAPRMQLSLVARAYHSAVVLPGHPDKVRI